jgi:putative ABC transport system permease protein
MKLSRLALGNVRKSFRDYSIYFLTIAFGVCIFYVFNSIESQQVMMDPSSSQKLALQMLGRIMGAFSVFISAVLCFLIVYANGFLIKRRKREFGIYLILGMEKGAISRILVMETVLVGLAGLAVGMLMGVLVSQGMALVTAHLMGSKISSYRFVFSTATVLKTTLYFGLTFLFTLVFNVVMVNRQRLIDLLNSARTNEAFTPPRLARSVVLFVMSLVLLGIAYHFIGQDGFFANAALFAAGVVPAIGGTLLFFLALSGFFLKLIQQCKGVYLRDLNMFVLRQINSKVRTTYLSMTFVCLMVTLAISSLSTGTSVAGAFAAEQRAGTPFDTTLTIQRQEPDKDGAPSNVPYQELDPVAALSGQGIELGTLARSYSVVPVFESRIALTLTNPDGVPVEIKPHLIRLTDYNAGLAMQGKQALELPAGSFAVQANDPSNLWKDMLVAYLKGNPALEMRKGPEAAADVLRSDPSLLQTSMLETSPVRVAEMNLIVPDAYVTSEGPDALPVLRTILNVDYAQTATDGLDAFEAQFNEIFTDRNLKSPDGTILSFWTESRTNALQVGGTATTIVAYLALYLGIVFLIASAALLAIAQLSETSDNIGRYRLLARIGTEDGMLYRAAFSQIAIYFGAPLALALVHSLVGIRSLSAVFAAFKDTDILSGSLFAALVIVLVYGGYFLATYAGSKRILTREAIHRTAQGSTD